MRVLNELGTGPVNRLLDRSNHLNAVNDHNDDGSVPLILLLTKFSSTNHVRLPILLGSGLLKLLEFIDIALSLVKLAIGVSGPVRPLASMTSVSSLVRLDIVLGKATLRG